jgi:hypothetical protein
MVEPFGGTDEPAVGSGGGNWNWAVAIDGPPMRATTNPKEILSRRKPGRDQQEWFGK